MVLHCNPDPQSYKPYQTILNRCVEKNEILNIYVKLKYEKKNEPKYKYTPPPPDDDPNYLARMRSFENYTTFKNKSKMYDYVSEKKAHEENRKAMLELSKKY